MEHKKTSGSDSDRKLGVTETSGVLAGVATGALTFWLELRNQFYHALEKTAIYDDAKAARDKALKEIKKDTPDFFKQHNKVVSNYKAATDSLHRELHVKTLSPTTLKNRWGVISKSEKLGTIEKAGTFGFMAATLVIGCGVLLEISRNQQLKHQLEEKELSQAPAKA